MRERVGAPVDHDAARRLIAEMDARHATEVARIRAAAQAEAQRILGLVCDLAADGPRALGRPAVVAVPQQTPSVSAQVAQIRLTSADVDNIIRVLGTALNSPSPPVSSMTRPARAALESTTQAQAQSWSTPSRLLSWVIRDVLAPVTAVLVVLIVVLILVG